MLAATEALIMPRVLRERTWTSGGRLRKALHSRWRKGGFHEPYTFSPPPDCQAVNRAHSGGGP